MNEHDGLKLDLIQPYAEQKHRLLTYYASLFARAMREKWDSIVYLDLYSGPGKATIEGTSRIVNTSSLLVLGLENKFDKYIFCDSDAENVVALKSRIAHEYSSFDTHVEEGNINDKINEIIKKMPVPRGINILGFCFLDPYKMSNLRFSTIKNLTARYMDFLILIPTGMDAKRAEQYYIQKENKTVDLFLGNDMWRNRWSEEKEKKKDFGNFIIKEYSESMKLLGFKGTKLEETVPVRNEKNRIVYRLAFYSKDDLGIKLFKQSRKYSTQQLGMFET
jgi:three-Cys-motif partner protein